MTDRNLGTAQTGEAREIRAPCGCVGVGTAPPCLQVINALLDAVAAYREDFRVAHGTGIAYSIATSRLNAVVARVRDAISEASVQDSREVKEDAP